MNLVTHIKLKLVFVAIITSTFELIFLDPGSKAGMTNVEDGMTGVEATMTDVENGMISLG